MTETPTQKHAATVERTIPLTADQVFDYLTTLENNPRWNWSVTATTPLTHGPVAPGSRYLQVSTAEPDHPQTLEVTRLEAPFIFEVVASGDRLSATYRYELEAVDRKLTRLRLHAQVEPHHPVGRPDLYVDRLKVSLSASLDALRGVLIPAHHASPPRADRHGSGRT